MIGPVEQLGLGAGLSVVGPNQAFGTIGILAAMGDGEIVGLTVRTAVPAGAMCTVYAGEHVLELGPGAPAPEGVSEEAIGLITQVTIPERIRVHSEFGGLDEARPAISPRGAWGQDLWLVKGPKRVPLGRLSALDATNFRIVQGNHVALHRTAEVECPAGLLEAGDAGAVVTTSRGRPVGMVIGSRPGVVIIAPLQAYLELNGLRLLRLEDASERYRRVLDLQAEQEEQLLLQLDRTPQYDRRLDDLPEDNKSSDEIRAEHPFFKKAA
jgi:hypothetical protein